CSLRLKDHISLSKKSAPRPHHGLKPIAHGVNVMVVGVNNIRQDFARNSISFIRISPELIYDINASWMNNHLFITANMGDTILYTSLALGGSHNSGHSLTLKEADTLRPGAVRACGVSLEIWYCAANLLRRLIDLKPYPARLML